MSDDEAKWFHLFDLGAPQVEMMSEAEAWDLNEEIDDGHWRGPFETFEAARKDLEILALAHVSQANGLVERVRAMRGKGRKR